MLSVSVGVSPKMSGFYVYAAKKPLINLSIRIIFIRDYTLKSLRLKQDKWNKLIISDEQRSIITNFVEKGSCPENSLMNVDKPESKSKVQALPKIPMSQIQKGKSNVD